VKNDFSSTKKIGRKNFFFLNFLLNFLFISYLFKNIYSKIIKINKIFRDHFFRNSKKIYSKIILNFPEKTNKNYGKFV
jgi:hypothetical protein